MIYFPGIKKNPISNMLKAFKNSCKRKRLKISNAKGNHRCNIFVNGSKEGNKFCMIYRIGDGCGEGRGVDFRPLFTHARDYHKKHSYLFLIFISAQQVLCTNVIFVIKLRKQFDFRACKCF